MEKDSAFLERGRHQCWETGGVHCVVVQLVPVLIWTGLIWWMFSSRLVSEGAMDFTLDVLFPTFLSGMFKRLCPPASV